jgi:hypothetical protein
MMAVAPTSFLFDEILDFLTSTPTLEQIAAYKPSDALNQRLHYLLEQNSHDALSAEERAELQEFLRMDHFLTMLKGKARLKSIST